jgi:hypothetical protein
MTLFQVEQYLETAWDGYRRAENWTHAVRASVFLAELLSTSSPRQAALTLQVCPTHHRRHRC